MDMAVKDLGNGVAIRKAAEKYSVPKSTLSDLLTGRVVAVKSWGNEIQLCLKDEKQLIGIATERAEIGIGFTKCTL
ncbi:hypothetical protein DPMN_085631 [Dreissena polymorpha]|uniref:HTH psq-type domain-containing protein n=1 Tax=Dreissena polymorpha TaxID=45954 RepID=A0A9D3Y5Q5_DREPO|nr:hypothetical protein DPMN_081284 [Dreissena polymorpha]KAH3698112.1 hypothetical protein DPMN_085631 [Dreissena polymorpha]